MLKKIILKKIREIKWYKVIKDSGMFDVKYYLFEYPDVRNADIDPIKHYIQKGVNEGKNPSAEFSTLFYIQEYEDVKKTGVNPLAHYIILGKKEGRLKNEDELAVKTIKESGMFDEEYYLSKYLDVREADADPIKHYIKFGAKEDRNPSKLFNTNFYRAQLMGMDYKNINLLVHYILYGQKEGINCIEPKSEIRNKNYFDELFKENNISSLEYIEFKEHAPIKTDIKLIAFYLPQFHPIPQNDKAWGKGFTEWTNVSKALPQFQGHYQPRLPGELGFYDLRLIDIQKRQIELAKNYGLHGFCYHYYWFDGKKVMETPLEQVLNNPELDFPFCINWANENWTKRWDGLDQDVILTQNHTPEDDLAFLEAIVPILTDKRYIRIDGKALLMIYRPNLFPDIKATVQRWRDYAKQIGIGELYLVLSHAFEHIDPATIGFDAATEFAPNSFPADNMTNKYNFFNKQYEGNLYDYESAIGYSISYEEPKYTKFRSLCPSWDNEARKPGKGTSFVRATPDSYSKWLEYILYYTNKHRRKEEKLVFINAWNEWAEGAYLEPDRKLGYAYLEKTHQQLSKFSNEKIFAIDETHTDTKQYDTAVIIHLHYLDLWEEMKNHLNSLNGEFDLYVNINNNCDLKFIKEIKNEFPNVTLFSCENRGRDILPFVEILEYTIPLNYTYICKIHTKKSLHRQDGDTWRNHLIDSLLKSEQNINKAKQFIDDGAGIVVAKGNMYAYKEWKGSNDGTTHKFAKKAKINMPDDFIFPAGSMFWFTPAIFEKLIENIDTRGFEVEMGQVDGTKAHAVERIFGLLCLDKSYRIETI